MKQSLERGAESTTETGTPQALKDRGKDRDRLGCVVSLLLVLLRAGDRVSALSFLGKLGILAIKIFTFESVEVSYCFL